MLHTLFSRRYAGAYRRARILFTFDLALIAIMLAVGTTGLVWYLRKPQPNIVQVSFEAQPKEIRIGDLLDLTVSYANRSKKQTFDEARAEVELPPDFEIHGDPISVNTEIGSLNFPLGTLKPGAQGSFAIRGVPWGALHDTQRMTVRLHLKDAKTGKVKEEITPFVFALNKSALEITLEASSLLFKGEIVEGLVRVKNTGARALTKIEVRERFDAQIKNLTQVPYQRAWTFDALAPGEERIIDFVALLDLRAPSPAKFALEGMLKGKSQGAQTHERTLADPGVTLSFSFDDNSPSPGDTVTAKATVSASRNLKGAFLALRSNPFISTPEVLSWTLGDLKAGETVTKSGTFKIRDSIEVSAFGEEKRLILKTFPHLVFAYEGSVQRPAGTVAIAGDKRETKIGTRARLLPFARYFTEDGDQLGRGPLPPQVGKTTKYWVFWNITNSTNEIKDVRVQGVLPPNVEWTGKMSASEGDAPIYDPKTRTVSWRVLAIPAVPSERCPCVGASFEVALTPTFEDAGKSPLLMSGITLAATDTFTGEHASVSAPKLTTASTDPVAKAKSAVRE